MAKYKIQVDGMGTKENPYVITKGTNYDEVTKIDLHNSYVTLPASIDQYSQLPSNLTAITNGFVANENCEDMFDYAWDFKVFESDLPNCTIAERMFMSCGVEIIKSNMDKVVDAYCMLGAEDNELQSFSGNLSSLKNANEMFTSSYQLTSFTTNNLNSLEDATEMFYNTQISTFTYNLPNLITGKTMFCYCTALTTFNIDMPNLQNSYEMFQDCKSLTSFTCNQTNINNCAEMFYSCSALKNVTINLPNIPDYMYMFDEECTALERVDITTNQGNESAFTKVSLGLKRTSQYSPYELTAKLYVNGVEVTD